MAIPTSFINYTPVAATTKTCKMLGHDVSTNGIHLIDVLGTRTPTMIVLDANMSLVMTAAFTNAQVIAALKQYLRELGVRDDAGGYIAADPKQIAPLHSVCT